MVGLQDYSSTIPYLKPPLSPNSKRIKQEAAEDDWARRLTRDSEVANHPNDAEPLPESYGLEKMEKLERYALHIEDVLDDFRIALVHDDDTHPFNDDMKLPEHNEWPYIKFRNLKKHVGDWWKLWQWVQRNWCYNAPVLGPGFKGRDHLRQVLEVLNKFDKGLMRVKSIGKKTVTDVEGEVET